MVLIGHDGEPLRREILETRPEFGARVTATGDLDHAALASHFQACDVMLQPYPDGVSARRTSTLALLASGCSVVTNSGIRTEAFWTSDAVVLFPAPDAARIGQAAVDLLEDSTRRDQIRQNGRQLYDRLFDI